MRNMDRVNKYNDELAKKADEDQQHLWDIYLRTGSVAAVAKAGGFNQQRASQIVARGIKRRYIPEDKRPKRGRPPLATA